MKSWAEFNSEEPELAKIGINLLFRKRQNVGLAFLATLRKDGAPRLHPVALVLFNEHLFVFIPRDSPKCADLKRDGRYALQAFPPPENETGEEFFLSGTAVWIREPSIIQAIVAGTGIHVAENEMLFEFLLERAMYTRLVEQDTPNEHPLHIKWQAEG